MGPLPGVVIVMGMLPSGDPRQAGGDGPSLAAVVAAHGPLPVSSVLSLAAGLAQALSLEHADGVGHRNINPASVLLAADAPRLIGYGGPQAAGLGQAPPGETLDFRSPEQAAGLPAGPASDIFSLGAVLLYAATGNLMSHFAWHLDQLPGELRPVIERCMAADPARRPTADKLLTELTAARPGAVSHVGWPAQAGIPSAPFLAQIPSGAGNARKRPSRFAALVRRNAWLIVTAALAFAVAAAGTGYVIHFRYPVLRPTGLTAGQRGATSISLGWSNPASGPLPDKYVILRDGAVAATVRGNVNHFTDSGLAPATTYDFRIIAYRGHARSRSSLDLRAATRTPPLSDAVFNSIISVTEKLTSGGSGITGDHDGDVWHDNWAFTSSCAVGSCATRLSGAVDNEPFETVLRSDGTGNLTAVVPINNYYYCGSKVTNYSQSALVVTVTPAAASVSGTRWQASKLAGELTWNVAANPNGNCGGATLVIVISG